MEIQRIDDIPKTMVKPKRKQRDPLPAFYNTDKYEYEIGIDEAGRGPMFGRVYIAAVVLPKDDSMNLHGIHDSKKVSKRLLPSLYDYIIQHALAYHITYIEPSEIDDINIRESVVKGMHICAEKVIQQIEEIEHLKVTEHSFDSPPPKEKYFLMVDGNDFPPYHHLFHKTNEENKVRISYETIKQGDNKFANIAAASILAKVARDNYVLQLCKKYSELVDVYSMHEHMGYGTKKHIEAIKKYGITQFHRKTFGICKQAKFLVL